MIKQLYDLCLSAKPTRSLVRSLRGGLYRTLGVPEAYNEVSLLAKSVDATLLVDIGCFQGDTIQRFRETGVHCPIVGFDPVEQNIQIAKEKLQGRDDIHLITAALSNIEGEHNFFVNSNAQTSSLLENDEGNVHFLPEDTKHERQIAVKTMTLDSWGQTTLLDTKRTIIKCDAQGAELRVIQGGKRLFSDCVVGFYGEVQLRKMYHGQPTFEELDKTLEGDFDLVLHNLYRCLQDREGRALQTDALWIKRPFLGKV